MAELQSFAGNIENCTQGGAHLVRPRIWKLLDDALVYPIIVVCAGAGYGKTCEIYSYLRKYEARTIWLKLSGQDNAAPRFWDNFTAEVARARPGDKASFIELGFPAADDGFNNFVELIDKTSISLEKSIYVFDDFHVLRDPALLRFFEKFAGMLPAGANLVLISRAMPDINLIGMMRSERIIFINEDNLCFSEDEIDKYFCQLKIPINRHEIREIHENTQGWAFAVNLIGRSLLNHTGYNRYSLDVMKENIYSLIDKEISRNISKELFRFLLRIALVDIHAAGFFKTLTRDDAIIREMELLNAYIRYDFNTGSYRIHRYLLEYLQKNQQQLTDVEKREIYEKAGEWSENGANQKDALAYYEKAGDYGALLKIINTFCIQPPLNIAGYAFEILERSPKEAMQDNPLYPAMKLKLMLGLGLMEEASALAGQYAAEYEARPESAHKYRALSEIYGVWAYLRMLMCPYTGVFDFDAYFEKQRIYYDKASAASGATGTSGACVASAAECGTAPVAPAAATLTTEALVPATLMPEALMPAAAPAPEWAYALLIGPGSAAGAPEEYIAALARAIPHASHVTNGNLYGLDDFAQGELYFYRQDLDRAEQYLTQAKDKAFAKGQFSTYNRATQYLMFVAFFRGDINTAIKLLQQMEALLNEKDYPYRYEAYDIACSHYYLAICQPEQMPEWLKADFSPYAHPVFLENYANLLKAQYRYLTRKYSELLAFLENAGADQGVLLGKIKLVLLKALSLYRLKRREEAVAALAEAYRLAAPHKILTQFTYFGKDMRTLSATALKDDKCGIPRAWLENVNRKSSAFAKRQSRMISHYMTKNGYDDEIHLTKRETEVLKELSRGLSRTEIAGIQNISINTVKMVINIIYEKLSVTSLPEAICAAIERKII